MWCTQNVHECCRNFDSTNSQDLSVVEFASASRFPSWLVICYGSFLVTVFGRSQLKLEGS